MLAGACNTTPAGPNRRHRQASSARGAATEEEAFLAMVRPFEQRVRRHRPVHGHARPQRHAVGGRRQGPTARCRRPARPRPDGRVRALRLAQGPGGVIDISQYKADTVPTFIDLGTVDGKLVGVFIKATLKGLIWYNPNVFTVDRPTTLDDLEIGRHARRGRARAPGASRLGSDGDVGLAGHRLDRGHRPAPERAGRLRRLGRRSDAVDFAGDQERVPVSTARS